MPLRASAAASRALCPAWQAFGAGAGVSDIASLAFLDAWNTGILVSASTGNSGLAADTVNHREPRIATVGASTLDRLYLGTSTVQRVSGAFTPSALPVAPGFPRPRRLW